MRLAKRGEGPSLVLMVISKKRLTRCLPYPGGKNEGKAEDTGYSAAGLYGSWKVVTPCGGRGLS